MIRSAQEIEGWMAPVELEWLERTAARMESVIEIGCWKGRSTFALLSGCKGRVTAVDHWLGSRDERNGPHREALTGDVFGQFVGNVGNFANLEIVRLDSREAARTVEAADLVFIDAGHGYDEVIADIQAWKPKAKKMLAGHDYTTWPSVRQAVDAELGPVQVVGSIWFQETAA